jgi:hypothetical protein
VSCEGNAAASRWGSCLQMRAGVAGWVLMGWQSRLWLAVWGVQCTPINGATAGGRLFVSGRLEAA